MSSVVRKSNHRNKGLALISQNTVKVTLKGNRDASAFECNMQGNLGDSGALLLSI